MRRSHQLRDGTSISVFEAEFPDDQTCVRHVFETRFGRNLDCPRCGCLDGLREKAAELRFRCGRCGHRVCPLAGTFLESLKSPPRTLFYAALYSANSLATPAAAVLARHLGWSLQAAKTFGRRIRTHCLMREAGRKLGSAERPVHLEVFKIKGLYKHGEKGSRSARILVLSDGAAIAAGVLPLIAPVWVFQVVRRHVDPCVPLFSHDAGFADRLRSYRQRRNTILYRCDPNPSSVESINASSAFWIFAITAIRRVYYIVSVDRLADYLGEQVFRFNRRDREIFWELLSDFPWRQAAGAA